MGLGTVFYFFSMFFFVPSVIEDERRQKDYPRKMTRISPPPNYFLILGEEKGDIKDKAIDEGCRTGGKSVIHWLQQH